MAVRLLRLGVALTALTVAACSAPTATPPPAATTVATSSPAAAQTTGPTVSAAPADLSLSQSASEMAAVFTQRFDTVFGEAALSDGTPALSGISSTGDVGVLIVGDTTVEGLIIVDYSGDGAAADIDRYTIAALAPEAATFVEAALVDAAKRPGDPQSVGRHFEQYGLTISIHAYTDEQQSIDLLLNREE